MEGRMRYLKSQRAAEYALGQPARAATDRRDPARVAASSPRPSGTAWRNFVEVLAGAIASLGYRGAHGRASAGALVVSGEAAADRQTA